jgi:cell fate (sporulation/competence/biofilm development) regulator YlbF (YheA/YmcA/DUF963 family)
MNRVKRQDLHKRLQELNRGLLDCYTCTETEFVGLARSLRELYEVAQGLAELVSGRLGSVRKAIQETRVAGADGLAEATLRDLQSGLDEAARELGALRAVGAEFQKLRTQLERIDRVGVSVRASVFGFAVETARTLDGQHGLGSFIDELRALGDKITNVAHTIGEDLEEARHSQAQESKQLERDHTQLCQLAEKLEATAGETAAGAQQAIDQVLTGLSAAEAGVKQIMRHANEAVYYLQFGDIVRQKTEHVTEALREAANALAMSNSRTDFSLQAASADQIISIQIGQLRQIRAEVEAAREQLLDSFTHLAARATGLQEALAHWQKEPTANDTDSAQFEAFKSALASLEDLHQQGESLRVEARQSTEQVVTASRRLSTHMRQVENLNQDIHLLALNAIIKTAGLGSQGATLSVLSMHVDSLYRESQDIVAEVSGILRSVVDRPLASLSGPGGSSPLAPEERMQKGIREIDQACASCRQAFESATELVVKEQEALRCAQAKLVFLQDHAFSITKHIDDLQLFRETLALWTDATSPVQHQGLDSLHTRYTMQSERETHERTSARSPTIAKPPTPTPATNCSADTAGRQTPSVAETMSNRNDQHPQSVPLVGSTSAPTDLGDNVELF